MAPVSPKSATRRPVRFGHRVVLSALAATAVGIGAIELAQPSDDRSDGVVLTCLCVMAGSFTFLALERSQRRQRRGGWNTRGAASAPAGAVVTAGARADIVTARARPAGDVQEAPAEAGAEAAPAVHIADTGPDPGDVLGSYQLLACVAEGSTARTWSARQINSTIERIVTIKTALGRGDADTDARRRFISEARIASLLRHPNVCGAYETGNHDGVLYRVQEWCDGASLRELLDRLPGQRIDFRIAALIVAKVSAGVHAAHELEDDDGAPMHVVHGALSPRHVHISGKGQVKVSGFGSESTGAAFEEPPYVAPEQHMGRAVDSRTDVFALGCLLYETTLGRSPLEGRARAGVPEAAPAPRTISRDYPEELEAIVRRALAPDPAARHASAEELGVALRGWLTRSEGVLTEQVIGELMTRAAGPLMERRAEQLRDAMRLWPRPGPPGLAALADMPAARPTSPERPTLPAAPRAHKSSSG